MKDRFNPIRYPTGVCGKVCFDKRMAQTKRNSLLKNGNERYLRIYNCPLCSAWHLTSEKQGQGKYGHE